MKTNTKIKFDPKNIEHLKAFKSFRDQSNWKNGCPFQVEWPYNDVPSMIIDRLINTYMGNIIDWNNKTTPIEKK